MTLDSASIKDLEDKLFEWVTDPAWLDDQVNNIEFSGDVYHHQPWPLMSFIFGSETNDDERKGIVRKALLKERDMCVKEYKLSRHDA